MVKHLQKIILAAVMLLSSNVIWAYDFSAVNNGVTIYYNITNDTAAPYTVEVTYMNNNYNSYYGNVTIPSSATYNGRTYSVTTIGDGAFAYCAGLSSVSIPNTVTSIGEFAFTNDTSLTSINIPNSVINIGRYAFQLCSGLTSITIPNSVVSIGNPVFNGCYKLSAINVSAGNNHFKSADGVLFNYAQDTLICYPPAKVGNSYNIPNQVTCIDAYAFPRCTGLITVTIPNSVTSIGNYAFYACTGLTSITIPNSVASIGGAAFGNCSGLTSISIPNSVRSIGDWAFQNCTSLDSVTIPNSVSTIDSASFYGCTGLTTVVIPNSVRSIGDGAFQNCTGLASITIPNSVRGIGNSAFFNCTGFNHVNIPDSVSSIGTNAFYNVRLIVYNGNATGSPWGAHSRGRIVNGDFVYADVAQTNIAGYIGNGGNVTIPNAVTRFSESAFYNCSGITIINIPSSVKSIGSDAFVGCSGLNWVNYTGTLAQWCDINFGNEFSNPVSQSHNLYINNGFIANLIIPNNVDTIKAFAFSGDTAITTLSIPNTVRIIGEASFRGCNKLTSVTIPNSVTSIGNSAFYACSSLNSLTLGNSVANIGELSFAACSSLTTLIIPNSVTSIGNSAFLNCSGLNSLTLGNSVASIGNSSFGGCSRLTTLTIPNSVTSIGNGAFNGCSSLNTLTIGKSVKRIETMAFANCSSLATVYYNADSCSTSALYWEQYQPNYAFRFDNPIFLNSGNHANIIIGNNVKCIPDLAFLGLFATSVTIGDSVITIGDLAFYNFPQEAIDYWGWGPGPYLTSITVPQSVTSIGIGAFGENDSLSFITFHNDSTTINFYAFGGVPTNIPVNVNCGATSWYRSQMSSFSNFVEFVPYNYSIASQDTTKGSVATIIAPNCNNGATWIIRATANSGYVFTRWSDGDTNSQRIITVNKDTALTAYFSLPVPQWYNFVVASEDTNKGTVQIVNQPSQASPQATIIALPNTGFRFTRWSDGNTQNPRLLTVTRDTTLIAFFSQTGNQWYNFAAVSEDTVKGSVQVLTQPSQASPQATIIAVPNTGYRFTRWSDGNTQNPRTLTVTQDTMLIAYFSWYNFSVASEDTAKGTVQVVVQPTPANPQATIVALPNTGYTFTRWSDGNTQNPRTLTVTRDTTLIAYFTSSQQQWYNFAVASEDTAKGSVQVLTQPSQASPQATIIAVPNTGYRFTRWSDGNTQNPRTLTVTQDTMLIAYFSWYNFSVASEDTAKGTVQVVVQPTPANPQATIIALPNTGYTFARWSDGNTQNPRSLTVTQDTTLVAYFTSSSQQQWYNFVVISEDTNKGSVQIVTQPTQASPQATIIALPNTGYTFARWSDGNTQNPRSLTVTQDTVLVACFTQSGNQWFNFAVVSEDPAKGTVQVVTQPTQENPQAIIVALPNTGYTFTRWSDGNTQNPRTLTVTQDTVLIAFFASNQGIAESENDNISVRTVNGHILLEGVSNERVYVSDVLGRVVYHATVNERAEIAVRKRGVYFVKVGNRPAQKVVVM